jgi:hypothetical protein
MPLDAHGEVQIRMVAGLVDVIEIKGFGCGGWI